jgi:hypothetical protein
MLIQKVFVEWTARWMVVRTDVWVPWGQGICHPFLQSFGSTTGLGIENSFFLVLCTTLPPFRSLGHLTQRFAHWSSLCTLPGWLSLPIPGCQALISCDLDSGKQAFCPRVGKCKWGCSFLCALKYPGACNSAWCLTDTGNTEGINLSSSDQISCHSL